MHIFDDSRIFMVQEQKSLDPENVHLQYTCRFLLADCHLVKPERAVSKLASCWELDHKVSEIFAVAPRPSMPCGGCTTCEDQKRLGGGKSVKCMKFKYDNDNMIYELYTFFDFIHISLKSPKKS